MSAVQDDTSGHGGERPVPGSVALPIMESDRRGAVQQPPLISRNKDPTLVEWNVNRLNRIDGDVKSKTSDGKWGILNCGGIAEQIIIIIQDDPGLTFLESADPLLLNI